MENRPVPIRYSRHLLLPEFGEEGQRKLGAARVLIVGLGGLGSPAALYLAAAGVGTLGLVDFDAVDETNLQRQIIHDTPSIGRPKLESAATRLRALNPDVALELHNEPFGASNGQRLVDAYDVIVDGTDNFATRYLVNDACVLGKKPNVYGSIFRFDGQASVFATADGPCYRCLHPEPPPPGLIPSCAEAGVLGVLPGVIGTIQATEAIKIISGVGWPLIGRLLLYDALAMKVREVKLPRDPDCPICGTKPTIHTLVRYDQFCDPTENQMTKDTMTVDELKAWRDSGEPHLLLDVRESSEHASRHIEGSMLVPSGTLQDHLDALPKDRPVVVHCQSGGRSSRATAMLRARGIDARNLTGGILAWADRYQTKP